jgi:hypothetical protein
MRQYHTVTDAELERARHDVPFRQQMLANNLDRLLVELNRLRNSSENVDKASALHLREGALLAVKLADLLHAVAKDADVQRAS